MAVLAFVDRKAHRGLFCHYGYTIDIEAQQKSKKNIQILKVDHREAHKVSKEAYKKAHRDANKAHQGQISNI